MFQIKFIYITIKAIKSTYKCLSKYTYCVVLSSFVSLEAVMLPLMIMIVLEQENSVLFTSVDYDLVCSGSNRRPDVKDN